MADGEQDHEDAAAEHTPETGRTPRRGREGGHRRPGGPGGLGNASGLGGTGHPDGPTPEDIRRELRRMMQQADAHEPGDRRRGRREGGHWQPGGERRGFADLRFTRGVFALNDQGNSAEEIAEQLDVPVEEITRRLARRELYRGAADLRDIVIERQSGTITTDEMISKLSALSLTAHTPGKWGAYDGAASATGAARQLMAALRDGLITEAEYEAVRQAAARRRSR
ncbi:hypothetical protein D9V32_06805 [Mycetocola tolaasinivorans]|uniref:Uncharacterized protein n=1 Tax=Mycetocola tolaasinivorans TaxID=76635 RepID=A0A3L7AB31_9MICO|nr:hypothetical protein [Mycetocola tolaasinivorans]RLP76552.1 hypothetical protein D9V32_06805 [Mycetocola tolaasinivorans]